MTNAIIVDDEKTIVDILADLLDTIDITILGVGYNGKDAVELTKQHEPDFLFLDLMMPEYNGFYAIKEIRKFNTKIEIIIITGDVSDETTEKLKTYGITNIIHKPVDFDYLLTLVK